MTKPRRAVAQPDATRNHHRRRQRDAVPQPQRTARLCKPEDCPVRQDREDQRRPGWMSFRLTLGGETMAQIRHIAIASDHPGKAADFYKKAFGFREVARHGFDPKNLDDAPSGCAVIVTDGYISMALPKLARDQTGVGLDYGGLHHSGLVVD